MTRSRLVAALSLLVATVGGATHAAGPTAPLALVGATLVDGTGAAPVADATVVVEGRRIACAGPRDRCPVPEGARTIDLAGRWIAPGMVDAHVHFSQTGWADGRPDALDVRGRYPYAEVVAGLEEHPERFLHAHLCSGTTAVFDVGGYPWTLDLAARAAADPRAPRVRAAGPLLSTWDFWLNLPAEKQFLYLSDPAAAVEQVGYLAARGADAVKVWFIPDEERSGDEMEQVVSAVGAEASRRGLPLIVHATDLELAKSALRAGAELLVHSVDDQPVDQELLDLARRAGATYCPTLTVARGYLRLQRAAVTGEAPRVDDPNGCVDRGTLALVAETAELAELVPEGESTAASLARLDRFLSRREETAATNLLAVHRAGIPIAMGTDAGNPLTLHGPSVYAELEAMEAAGLTPMEVLVAATAGGARALGLDREIGTVEAGKAADLVVLGEDPTASASAFRSVRQVMKGGALYRVDELAAPGD